MAALDPDRDLIEVCNSVLSKMPNPPAYRESGSAAYYMPREDLVNLPSLETFKITEGYVATKFHEFAHSTGHEPRLNRPGIMEVAAFGGEQYGFEELVAELTSAYLCARNGIDNTLENSFAYIQHWLQVLKNDKTMLLKASGKATAAVEYILAGGHNLDFFFLCIAQSSPSGPGSPLSRCLRRSRQRPLVGLPSAWRPLHSQDHLIQRFRGRRALGKFAGATTFTLQC